jgi:hypothetical protein
MGGSWHQLNPNIVMETPEIKTEQEKAKIVEFVGCKGIPSPLETVSGNYQRSHLPRGHIAAANDRHWRE